MVKNKIKIPHTLTIIFLLIVLMAILTWIIPSGEFLREEIGGRLVVIPNTYTSVYKNPQGFVDVFRAPIDGFVDAAEVVGFVLIVGGSFGMINKTGAIEAGIGKVITLLKGREGIIIPVAMILFGLGGTTFGMSEETLPFYMIFILLMLNLGYDSLTGISVVFIGAMTGTMASTINPFSVGIAQALAQIIPGHGVNFRFIIFITYMIVSICFVMMYAKKVKLNPKKSIVYNIDKTNKQHFKSNTIRNFTFKDANVLTIFAVGMMIMVYGVLYRGWYISLIAMNFLAIGVVSSIVAGLNQEEIAKSFVDGVSDMILAALAISMARGIVIIAQNGFIIDTILNYSANFLSSLHKTVFVYLTFLLEIVLAFFIPSSSSLASLTIPVLAPLSDLVDVSAEIIVSAYQFGVGFTNFITPTSGVLMGALAVSKIPLSKWFKFVMPLMAMLFVLSLIFLTIGIYIGF
jgi:uncharacterized ion transporter superfamily protein YfcC